MADGNLHRDTDKREPTIECTFVSIACELLVGLTVDDHRLAKTHHRDQTRDDPSYVYVQLSLCTVDTSRSPKKRNDFKISATNNNCKETYFTNGAMISGLDVILAVVTSVHEFILPLIVQLVKHAQS